MFHSFIPSININDFLLSAVFKSNFKARYLSLTVRLGDLSPRKRVEGRRCLGNKSPVGWQ